MTFYILIKFCFALSPCMEINLSFANDENSLQLQTTVETSYLECVILKDASLFFPSMIMFFVCFFGQLIVKKSLLRKHVMNKLKQHCFDVFLSKRRNISFSFVINETEEVNACITLKIYNLSSTERAIFHSFVSFISLQTKR